MKLPLVLSASPSSPSTKILGQAGISLAAAGMIYGLLGAEPSANLQFLAIVVVWLVILACLPGDAAEHRIPLVMDWQWFAAAGWPLVWLWYARHTGRRWGSTLIIASLPLAFNIGFLAGSVLSHFFDG